MKSNITTLKDSGEFESLYQLLIIHKQFFDDVNNFRKYNNNLDTLERYHYDLSLIEIGYSFTYPSDLARSEQQELDDACDYIEFLEDKLESYQRLYELITNGNYPI